MATTDSRPRIPTDLARKIDKHRGSVPFERWVRDKLSLAIAYQEHPEVIAQDALGLNTLEDVMYESMLEGSQMDWKHFEKAVQRAMEDLKERLQRDLEENEIGAEMDDEEAASHARLREHAGMPARA